MKFSSATLAAALPTFALAIATLATLATSPAFSAVDLGDASVMSQQGQRLKIAVVYGSSPGERVPVTRFSIKEVSSEGNGDAPKAEQFSISQPANRNIVYLQSADIVNISKLKLVMTAADAPDKSVIYNLVVPPSKSSVASIETKTVKKGKAMKKRSKAKRSKSSKK
jgi:hypothetical protein